MVQLLCRRARLASAALLLASGVSAASLPPDRPATAAIPAPAAFTPPTPPAAAPGRVLAITVDDLPIGGADSGLESITAINRQIVASLQREHVPAVGFVNEEKLHRKGELGARIAILESWLAAGLELGNHTWSHPDFHKVGLAAYEAEIVRGESVTRPLMARHGGKLHWFRQTFLRTGRTLAERDALTGWLAAHGYTAAPVTIENDDWYFNARYLVARRQGDRALAERIAAAYLAHWTTMFDFYEAMTDRLFHRPIPQVVLLHDSQLNADHLGDVLALMRARGYGFVELATALSDPAYSHPDSYAGPWGKSWLQRWLFTDGVDTLGKEPDPPQWVMDLPAK